MHTLTKHYLDNMLFKAIECKNVVCLKKLSDEAIENYKSINETTKEIDTEKSTESSNSSANTVPRIWVIDPKKIVNEKIYALFLAEMIKKPANSDGTIQHWVLAKNPDGIFQQIPLITTKKTQTTGNTTVQSLSIPKPLHNIYKSFSSSLQNTVSSESSIPKAVPTKKCFVVKPANTKTHLMQVATSSSETGTGTPTYMTFKSAVQNNKSSVSNPLQRAEGSTFLVGNKQYQLIKGSAGQMRAVMNGSNILVKSPPPTIIKCYAKDCNNPATIVCRSCTTVIYCSHNCQQRDWYGNHINDCERLLNKRQKRS